MIFCCNTIKREFSGIVLFIIFVLLASLSPAAVTAQQVTLSISPPLVETIIKPGKTILVAYTISNLGDPVVLSSDVRPFEPLGLYGDLVVKDDFTGPVRFSLDNSNIKLGDKFFLQSRNGQQLLLRIRIPEGTPEGDYYYTFYVQNDLGKPIEGSDAAQSQALVGSNILITVTDSGQMDVGGSIGKLDVVPRYSFSLFGSEFNVFESSDVIPIQLILQNTGRNLIKPDGVITLSGTFGENAAYKIVPQNILSQSSRMVTATPSAMLEAGSNAEKASLYLKGFFFGKYRLTADVAFGFGGERTQRSVEFYAFPFKLILASGATLLLTVLIVRRFR